MSPRDTEDLAPVDRKGARVPVVEDHDAMRDLVVEELADAGFTVEGAAGGRAGIDKTPACSCLPQRRPSTGRPGTRLGVPVWHVVAMSVADGSRCHVRQRRPSGKAARPAGSRSRAAR